METISVEEDTVSIPLLSDINGDDDGHYKSAIRSTTANTSFFKTCFNGLNALAGVAVLSFPYALASGGWLTLILLFVIAGITLYTALLIQRCMDLDPSIRSYPDIGFQSFGKAGKVVLSVLMHIELYLVATGFLIVEGDNLSNLLPDVGFVIAGYTVDARQSFIVIVATIILPTIWLNDMRALAYISAGGVLGTYIIIGSTLWAGAFDGIGFRNKGTLINWSGITTATSLWAYSFCTHPVFPTIYASMKNQNQFSKVLLVCFLVHTCMYSLMTVSGYLMFGSEVNQEITLNLPTTKMSARVAIYTTLIIPICKYALVMKPIVNYLEASFRSPAKRGKTSHLLRTALLVSTIVVAIKVKFFAHLSSLVGAFLGVTASVIVPCVCYLKISGTYRRLGFEPFIIGVIMLLGFIVIVVGTHESLVLIINL